MSLGYDNQSGQKPLNKWRVLPDLGHILYFLKIKCSNMISVMYRVSSGMVAKKNRKIGNSGLRK